MSNKTGLRAIPEALSRSLFLGAGGIRNAADFNPFLTNGTPWRQGNRVLRGAILVHGRSHGVLQDGGCRSRRPHGHCVSVPVVFNLVEDFYLVMTVAYVDVWLVWLLVWIMPVGHVWYLLLPLGLLLSLDLGLCRVWSFSP